MLLFQQLLSTEDGEVMKEQVSEGNQSIIHKLLDEDNKDNCRSVPAVSIVAKIFHLFYIYEENVKSALILFLIR